MIASESASVRRAIRVISVLVTTTPVACTVFATTIRSVSWSPLIVCSSLSLSLGNASLLVEDIPVVPLLFA